MKKLILLLVTLACFSITSQAQVNTFKKSMDKIMGTDFFKEFDSLKTYVQLAGMDAVKNKDKYSAEQYKKLTAAYDASVKEMNGVLEQMAADFTDKKKLKLIKNDAQTYINSYLFTLQTAKDHFKQNFLYEKSKMDQDLGLYTFNPAILIPIIQGAIQLVQEIKVYIDEIKKASLEQVHYYIVDQNKVHTWAELSNKS